MVAAIVIHHAPIDACRIRAHPLLHGESCAKGKANVESIVARLNKADSDTSKLLKEFSIDDYPDLWSTDARLFIAFARKGLSEDRLTAALDLVHGGLKVHPDDLELRYLRVLYHHEPFITGRQRSDLMNCWRMLKRS